MHKELKIPTFLALILLLVGLGSTIILVEKGSQLASKATTTSQPQKITQLNLTDNSLSVGWITLSPTVGLVKYQERSLWANSYSAYDMRDENNRLARRYTHFVSISGLKPETEYQLTFINDGKWQSNQALIVKTAPILPPPNHQLPPAYGSLWDEKQQPVTEALVYASFDGSQTVGTVVENGSWMIPLGNLRDQTGRRYFVPTTKDKQRLLFLDPNQQTSVVTTINNNSPLPPVILGENYDFTTQSHYHKVIIAQAQKFPSISGSINQTFQVLLPETDAVIPSDKPLFKGFGVPGKRVIITVNQAGTPLVGTVTVNSNRTWQWTPPALTAGKHSATIASFSDTDKPLLETRTFTILKSGTSVLGEATPSASLTPTPVPVIQASATPRTTPKTSPLVTPTLTPTFSPRPSATTTSVLETATWTPTLVLLIIALTGLTFGTVSFLKLKNH